jgi:cytosine/uracil/thiamine/allantoin permease
MQHNNDTVISDEDNALRPVTKKEKTWGSFAIFNVWANDIQSLFGYTLVASLFISFGVSGWTAFTALIAAGLFVMYMVNLSGGSVCVCRDDRLANCTVEQVRRAATFSRANYFCQPRSYVED